jgi:hypothetical protein
MAQKQPPPLGGLNPIALLWRRRLGRWSSSAPKTHHPDQPAAHTAFQTHWARLVSYMGHRSPHLRVLGGHFHHFKGHIPQAGQRAGRTRANFRVSDLAVAS